MSQRRIEKVTALLIKEISELINADFSEKYGLISVADVEITSDFKDAKVYISFLNNEIEKDLLKSLELKANEYQKILGNKLKMKYTPKLSFFTDKYQEKLDRVDKLLKEIHRGS